MKTAKQYMVDGQHTWVIPMSSENECLGDIHRAIRQAQHEATWAMAMEAAAQTNLDKTGRDWVPDSLWDRMAKQFGNSIRAIPCPPLETKEKE